jgi:hypothetical protein
MKKLSFVLVLLTILISLPSSALAETSTTTTADLALENKGWIVSPGLGLAQLYYHETGRAEVGQTSLDLKLNASAALADPAGLDLGSDFGMTLVPLSNNRDNSARFLSVDGHAGYTLPGDPLGLRIRLVGGIFFRKMFVANDTYGYSPLLVGPEAYPTISLELPNGQAVSGYVRILPVVSVSGFSGSNWEWAMGTAYRITAAHDAHDVKLTVDFNSQHVEAGGISASANSLTAGFSYGI